jgi:hypothetical protein
MLNVLTNKVQDDSERCRSTYYIHIENGSSFVDLTFENQNEYDFKNYVFIFDIETTTLMYS